MACQAHPTTIWLSAYKGKFPSELGCLIKRLNPIKVPIKVLLIVALCCLISLPSQGQFKYNKGVIDTELLSEAIQAKQEEAGKRLVLNLLKEFSFNDSVNNKFLESSLTILMKENSKKVIENQLLFEIIRYSVSKISEKSVSKKVETNTVKNANFVDVDTDSNTSHTIKDEEVVKELRKRFGKDSIIMNFENKYLKVLNRPGAKLLFQADRFRMDLKTADMIKDLLVTHLEDLEKRDYNYAVPAKILEICLKNLSIDSAGGSDFIFTIDVEETILDIITTFDGSKIHNPLRKGIWVSIINPRLLFNIGLNYAFFPKNQVDGSGSFNNVQYASEKLGLMFTIWDWKYTRDRPNGSVYKIGKTLYKRIVPQYSPFVSKLYWMAYGSGILYNIVDVKTNSSFSNSVAGVGIGIRLYNDLDFSVSYNSRFRNSNDKLFGTANSFINVSFDIPIPEYLKLLRKKKS